MSDSQKNPWLKPGFLTVVVLLALCAGGLNGVVSALQLNFLKAPVELKKDLTSVPARMGDWVQVSTDEPVNKELEDELGTKMYIFRDYVNTKLVSPADLARFDGKTSSERKIIAAQIQAVLPAAVLGAAVTYYTGKVDTVAHIPERCYVADGYQYTDTPETMLWDLGPGRLGKSPDQPQSIGVRFLNFEDQTGAKRVTKRVAYFFFANGQYESDNLQVRQTLQNLRAKHAFYSKVELMAVVPDHDQCAAVMKDFLRSALPEIEKCLPDWNSVEHPGVNAVEHPVQAVKG
jgi:hypothetical protein